MKRLLLFSSIALSLLPRVQAWENNQFLQSPPQTAPVIDDVNFVNNVGAVFDVTLLNAIAEPFETQNTLNYTNKGLININPGFNFVFNDQNYVPQPGVPFRNMAGNFVNTGSGPNAGVINASGSFLFAPTLLSVVQVLGNARIIVNATNIVNSGAINMGASSLLQLTGHDVNLANGGLIQTNAVDFFNFFAAGVLDGYWGVGLPDPLFLPLVPSSQFSFFPPSITPPHTVTNRTYDVIPFNQLFLANSQGFVNESIDASGSNRFVRAVFLNNTNADMTLSVYFPTAPPFFRESIVVEWRWTNFDIIDGTTDTNFMYLEDTFGVSSNLQVVVNGFAGVNPTYRPANYLFSFGFGTPIFLGAPAPPAPSPMLQFDGVGATNQYSAYQAIFTPGTAITGDVAHQTVAMLPGRVEVTAERNLDLTRSRISAVNYLKIDATNHFHGSENARIMAPNLDLFLGTTNNSLTLSNVIVPFIPRPSGNVNLYSARWTNIVDGITNRYHVLFVDSTLRPTSSPLVHRLKLLPDQLVIKDVLNVVSNLSLLASRITIATNAPGAPNPAGEINILSPEILWSPSTPNLQYFTNHGTFTAMNLVDFAGGMTGPSSSRALATPYQAFVNYGRITNNGTFIRANYIENTGIIHGNPFGSIDLIGNTARLDGGIFNASQGSVSILANSLLITNYFLGSTGAVTLAATNLLSDGHNFGNQFAQIITTNDPANTVSNGNVFLAGGSFSLLNRPSTGDLLGTSVTNTHVTFFTANNVWAGEDRGRSTTGFRNNVAVGRLVLDGRHPDAIYRFTGANADNAIYVDYLEFRNYATNQNVANDMTSIEITTNNMRIYFAQAVSGGISIAEKLDGRNGGGFIWVSNYAGVYSSTNILYPDGNTYIFNAALAQSSFLDSDLDGTVNASDPTPIPTNWVDVANPPVLPGDDGGSVTNEPGPGPGPGPGPDPDYVPQLPFREGSVGAPNSFTTVAGVYNGLFYEADGVRPESSGYFSGKTTSKGTFTAKLTLGKKTYSFSGQFDSTGAWGPAEVKGRNLPPLTIELQLDLGGGKQITGTIDNGTWQADLVADRAGYAKTRPTNLKGKYTLLIPADEGNPNSPAGDGFGSITIDSSGNVKWAGTLADGTKVSQKSALSKDNIWPLYSTLYGGAGTLISWVKLEDRELDDLNGLTLWIKPLSGAGAYAAGFTNETESVGAKVTGSAGFSSGVTMLTGGNLSSGIVSEITVSSANKVATDGVNNLKVTIISSSGLFKGTARNPDNGQTLLFQGALLPKRGLGTGFFLNANRSGPVYIGPAP